MAWKNKTEWRVSPGGVPYAVQTLVWVPDSSPMQDPKNEANAALAQRRALPKPKVHPVAAAVDPTEMANRNAAIAAGKKSVAAQQAKAKAAETARMYAALHAYTNGARALLAPQTAAAKLGLDPKSEANVALAQRRQIGVNALKPTPWGGLSPVDELRIEKLYAHDKAAGIAAAQKATQKANDYSAVLYAKSKPGDTKAAQDLEKVMERAKADAADGIKPIDTKFYQTAQEAYRAHAEFVSKQWNATVKGMDALLVKGKDGKNRFRSQAAYDKYEAISKSKEFSDQQAEVNRLFGIDQSKPKYKDEEGNAQNQFQYTSAAYEDAARAQRRYIADQAHKLFVGDEGDRNPGQLAVREKEWTDTQSMNYLIQAGDIRPGETSMVMKNGQYVHRSVEEEFAYRKSQYEAAINQRRVDIHNQAVLVGSDPRLEMQQELANRNAMFPGTSGLTPAQARDTEAMANAEKMLNPSGDKAFIKDHNNLDKTVDQAMKTWDANNKRLYQSRIPPGQPWLARSYVDGMAPKDRQAYLKAFADQKESFYNVYKGSTPSFIDKVAGSPVGFVANPVISTLSGIGGLIPATLRTINFWVSGGQGQFNMPINGGDVPPDVQKMMEQASKDAYAQTLSHGASNDSRQQVLAEQAGNAAGKKAMGDWLASPEGKAWSTKFLKDRNDEGVAEVQKFYNTVYGPAVPDDVKARAEKAKQDYIDNVNKVDAANGTHTIIGSKAQEAADAVIAAWKKTPAGQDFVDKNGSSGNLFDKLNAISEFGSKPTSNAALNMVIGMATDPTVALPLKPTTWAARIAHAFEATKDINGVKRVFAAGVAFQHVTEPELRAEKAIRLIADEVKANGGDGKVVAERLLAELAGIKDAGTRNKELESFMKKIGLNPNSTNGKLVLNSAQQGIVDYLKKNGFNYEDFAAKVGEAKAVREAELEAERAARPTAADIVSAKMEAENAAAKAQDLVKQQELEGVRAGQVVAAQEHLQTEVHAVLTDLAHENAGLGATVVEHGVASADVLKVQAKDPLTRTATPLFHDIRVGQEEAVGVRTAQYKWGEVRVPDAGERSATIINAISGNDGTVVAGEYSFAAGPFTDHFLQSQEYKDAAGVLSLPEPTNPHVPHGPSKEAYIAEMEDRAAARKLMFDARAESHAIHLREQQSVGRDGPPLVDGAIPFSKRGKDGVERVVIGGRPSGQQYILSKAAKDAMAGVDNPATEMNLEELHRAVQTVEKRVLAVGAKLKKAGVTGEALRTNEAWDSLRTMGVYRRNADISVDLAHADGMLVQIGSSQVEHVRWGLVNFVPVGQVMVDDYLLNGELKHYYDTLSLLPEMVRGPGYETELMDNIRNPEWRAQLSPKAFQHIFVDKFLSDVIQQPSPAEFRAGMTHLFALFHLTLLDSETTMARLEELKVGLHTGRLSQAEYDAGVKTAWNGSHDTLALLEGYSHVMDTILQKEVDPMNMYARAWKVMESRAGVPWARPFSETESAFIDAGMRSGSRLHPNMALQMIPYGPIARTNPISHGYMNHMRNFASTLNELFRASPARWTDDVVVARFGAIANPASSRQEGVTIASQIAHYVASRYGNSLRRARFGLVLHDYSIDATGKFRFSSVNAEEQYGALRDAWAKAQLETDQTGRKTLESAQHDFDQYFAAEVKGEGPQRMEEVKSYKSKWVDETAMKAAAAKVKTAQDELSALPKGVPAGSRKRAEAKVASALKAYRKGDQPAMGFRGKFREAVMRERREFPEDLRAMYQEAYWKNEVTHGNAGLHTSMFFEKMGDPRMADGDSWLRFANSYWLHMVEAGGESEARAVLGTMFEQRIGREVQTSVDLMRAGDRSATEAIRGGVGRFFAKTGLLSDLQKMFDAAEIRAGVESEQAEIEKQAEAMRNDLLIEDDALRETRRVAAAKDETTHMYDMASVEHVADAAVEAKDEKVAAEASLRRMRTGTTQMDAAMVHLEAATATLDKQESRVRVLQRKMTPKQRVAYKKFKDPAYLWAAKEHDDALVAAQKLASRAKKEDAAVEELAAAKASGEAERIEKAQAAVDKLKPGEHTLSPSRVVSQGAARPSDARMRLYHAKYRSTVKQYGKGAGEKYLTRLPPDVQSWMRAEVRSRAADASMYKLLNTVVRRTIDMESVPIHVGEQMAALVDVIKEMPNGQKVLEGFADRYYDDLMRTRLIDYIKNESWFEMREGDKAIDTALVDVTREHSAVSLARDKAAGALREVKDETEAQRAARVAKGEVKSPAERRAALTAEIAKHDASLDRLKAQREKILGSRANNESKLKDIEDRLASDAKREDVTPERRVALEAEQKKLIAKMQPRELEAGPVGVARTESERLTSLREGLDAARADLRAARGGTKAAGRTSAEAARIKQLENNVDRIRRNVRKQEAVAGPAAAAGQSATKAEASRVAIAAAEVRPRLDAIQRELQGTAGKMSDEERAGLEKQAETLRADIAGGKVGEPSPRANVGGLPTEAELNARTPRPYGPSPMELNSPRIAAAQQALDILQQMTEQQWLDREMQRMQIGLKTTEDKASRQAMVNRMRDIRRVNRVIEYAKEGGNGPYIKPKSRYTFAKMVTSTVKDRAIAVFAPKRISAFAFDAAGLEVEQGRSYNALWRNSVVNDDMKSNVREVGEVSATYAARGHLIEDKMALRVKTDLLQRNGFPPDILSELSSTMLLTNMDEFVRASKDPRWANFMRQFSGRADAEIRRLSGDDSYGLEKWLDDRLVERGGYFDSRKFDEIEQKVSDAIAAERDGRRKQGYTDLMRGAQEPTEFAPLAEMVENDVYAVVAKARVLSELGIDPHAYNEARRVLRTGLIQKRTGQSIVAGAEKAATDLLHSKGIFEHDAAWADEYKAAYTDAFNARRDKLAADESVHLLDQLAREMHGSTPNEVAAEFERRYGAGFDVTGGGNMSVTPFQKRTLEEAAKTHLGVTDLNDKRQMVIALSAHGQAPDFTNRASTIEWLKRYGFWSPRTADVLRDEGAKSWNIQTEEKYWMDHFGTVPEWADTSILREGGSKQYLLHDEVERGNQFRAWGTFSRNMVARFENAKMTRMERARFMVEGSEALGIKGKRDLVAERQYVIDYYGELAYDKQSQQLIAFPELMNRDELRNYIPTQSKKSLNAAGVFESTEVQDVFNQILDQRIQKLVDEKYLPGATVTWEDVFEMSSSIANDMLQHPVWTARPQDEFGKFLRGQATLRRSLIMAQPAFGLTNVVDTTIKYGYQRFTGRAFFNHDVSEAAHALEATTFGWDSHTQLLHDVDKAGTARWDSVKNGADRYYIRMDGSVTKETALEKARADAIQYLVGTSELSGQLAGKAENFAKLRMAQGMYDETLARFTRELGDPELADAAAKRFIKDEVSRLFPTVGDGPIERLFNSVFPFSSYQFKNHVLWLGELASHPAMFNYFNRIGDAIEAYNRGEWEKRGETGKYSDVQARRIELPWAPGVFIDLGQMSDAQAGLKPFYDMANGTATVQSLTSQFLRLSSAADLNVAYGMLNAMDFGEKQMWVQLKDADGYPSGEWIQQTVPWQAPWGGDANALNSIFGIELGTTAWNAAMDGKWSPQELSVMAYQALFFGAPKMADKSVGLNSFYFALKSKDPVAAQTWLTTTSDGMALKQSWIDKPGKPQDFNPQQLKDMLWPKPADKNPWFHSKDPAFQAEVKQGLTDLKNIQAKWENVLFESVPGSQQFKDAKLNASNERFAYIASHPWMYDYFAFSMTPNEWAAQQDQWTVDDQTNGFFNIKEPVKKAGESAADWQKAIRAWGKQRSDYLAAFPKVAERLAQSRTSVEAVWKQTEDHWFTVLDQIGTRSVAIEAAKASKNFKLVDQLYLANELDYSTLSINTSVDYFNPQTDFNPLTAGQKERGQDPTLRTDAFGNQFMQRLTVLPGFDQWRYNRMDAAGKATYNANAKYAKDMAAVIAKAKGSKNFGAEFVRLLKANPVLMRQYFAKNPGKEQKWASNDAYIKLISKYGLLAKAGKFTEAGKYFDHLPDWVKAKYFENPKHAGKRQSLQQNLQYMSYMKRWTDFYRRRDYSGGAKFFSSLPSWVRDRYTNGHPQGFKPGAGGTSPYSKAMGTWVHMLQSGNKAAAQQFFDQMPKEFKDRYYAGHPQQKLAADVKHVGMLGEYFSADDANRAQYLTDNPEFAKWLKTEASAGVTRSMLITAAYRALPKDDAWMRRAFLAKYPEIFSKEATGAQAIANVQKSLAQHPEMTSHFQQWLEAILSTYADELKHAKAPPRTFVQSDHSTTRQHGPLNKRRPHGGQSAAWVRLHSLQ